MFEDWQETPVHLADATFEAKVAAARAHYDSPAFVEPGEVFPTFAKGEVADLIAESDAKVAKRTKRKSNGHPAAPVRRSGTQSEKVLNSFAAPTAPTPEPKSEPEPDPTPEPPPENLPPAQPRKRRRKTTTTLDPASRQIEDISDAELLAEAGIEPFYSTTEAAQFFDKTNQWLYWGMGRDAKGGTPVFVTPDGKPIVPDRVGETGNARRRFTLSIIKEILLSNYRRGNVEPEELKKILRRIRINELGGEWREREGWVKIRGKWVHPDQAEKVGGVWIRKKAESEQKED